MELGCQLEVDVNGDEIFMVDKKVLACFSGRFRKLFSKLTGSTRRLKVIFPDFPGGADGFELVARFCYNNGAIEITPSNIVLLNSAAYFMEMGINSSATELNLIDQTEKSLEGINYWTWSELLVALKQCQDLFPATNSSFLLEKVLNSLIGRVSLSTIASPFRFSSENFSSQLSSDTSSICSTRNNCWWFEDLLFLNVNFLDKVTRMMVSQKLDHATIFKLLFFYMKSRLVRVGFDKKQQIIETIINLLSLLDRNCFSCKALFEILRVVSGLKTISKSYKLKLERLIGSQLDQATLDNILIRSPNRKHSMYDVKLVLRLTKAYLLEGWITPNRLKEVATLIDSYLIEIAPDFVLKHSTFAALLLVLPDSARQSSDRLYQAIDLYLEVHTQLMEEEKLRLCSVLNYKKLSAEALEHLAQNSKFPPRKAIQVFITQQCKHNSLIFNHLYSLKMVNCKLKMSSREEAEMEKVCAMMPNATKPRLCNPGKVRSLPKLCS